MRPDKEVFYKIAYSDIEKINYKNVLDLCCGTLNSIKHINKSERYIGVDAVKEVIEIARKRYPNSETYISKIEDFNINEQFDLIVCFEAIGINRDPLKEGILIAAEQAQDYLDIADGIHLMAVKAEYLIPEILKIANINLEY